MQTQIETYISCGFRVSPATRGRTGTSKLHPTKQGYNKDTRFSAQSIKGMYVLNFYDTPYFAFDVDGEEHPDMQSTVGVKTVRGTHYYWKKRDIPSGYELKRLHVFGYSNREEDGHKLPLKAEIKYGKISDKNSDGLDPISFLTPAGAVRSDGKEYELFGDLTDIPVIPEKVWKELLVKSETKEPRKRDGVFRVKAGTEEAKAVLAKLNPKDYPVDDGVKFGRLAGALVSDCDSVEEAAELAYKFYRGKHSRVKERVMSFTPGKGTTLAALRKDAGEGIMTSKEKDLAEKFPHILKDLGRVSVGWDHTENFNKAVNEINKYVIFIQDQAQYLVRVNGRWRYFSKGDMENQLSNLFFTNGSNVLERAFNAYNKSLNRRSASSSGIYYGYGEPEDYDLWTGIPTEPVQGDCSCVKRMIKEALCSGNEEQYNYMIGWMATLMQRPGKKMGTAICLRGEQGSGKSLLGEILCDVLGEQYSIAITADGGCDKFNSIMVDKALAILQEFTYPSSKGKDGVPVAMSYLKTMVTDERGTREDKNVKKTSVVSRFNLMLTMNTSSNFFLERGDRRFFLPDISREYSGTPDNPKNADMFGPVVKWRENKRQGTFLKYLLEYKIKDFDPRKIPNTITRKTLMRESLDFHDRLALENLERNDLEGFKIWNEDGCPLPIPMSSAEKKLKNFINLIGKEGIYYGSLKGYPGYSLRDDLKRLSIDETTQVLFLPDKSVCEPRIGI